MLYFKLITTLQIDYIYWERYRRNLFNVDWGVLTLLTFDNGVYFVANINKKILTDFNFRALGLFAEVAMTPENKNKVNITKIEGCNSKSENFGTI